MNKKDINPPLVSVIMPAYNCAQTIVSSIDSVIAQTYPHWELLVIDDVSTDNTVQLVRQIADDRVRLLTLKENSGSPAKPRNVGLDNAIGEYIAFLDSDDLWMPDKLQVQLNEMRQSGHVFSCSAYKIVDPQLNVIASYRPPSEVSYQQLLSNNSVGCLTAMLHKEVIGKQRFPMCGHEDYALWLKLVKEAGTILGVQQSLACYRKMASSVSSNKLKLIGFFWNIYRNEEGFSVMRSLYYCLRYLVNVTWFKYK